ncbi:MULTISPECIES: M55 family metallopeptidase [unclassified Imperialibacter]|uniref:M55 family metallopeptidase n=1 Tax=unclassified Imperialibacter TaxID=2629706 RepID=UPI00125C928F|nr:MULTISPECIES: M55 family metallopeptidase [unclassified Imperialibacter]CAD5295512.1 Aminopeptidase [Imperialibacter sp. 75]CAD5296259.1 Aminopeptidase [Imperialibacter sp. 89]VVT15041.1 Aminopeptidase [Imperialibacter sp. EC-SDR9]
MKKLLFLLLLVSTTALAQPQPVKLFISVDMEGIGGIGTSKMTSGGKDYDTGRKLMTDEVNAVVAAIFETGPATIVVNDSHGDMQNLLHTQLDPRVEYIQSNIKPLGMVQGLDSSFDGVIYIGYHAMAGTENGLLAHTGSGSVKGLWINGTEVGEGGLNTFFAGAVGVPVILASGDKTFTEEIKKLIPTVHTVSTKEAIGSSAAKLLHPDVVKKELQTQTKAALKDIKNAKPLPVQNPIEFVLKVDAPTRADVAMGIPGMKRVDGYTVSYQAKDMDEAYKLIRIIYKYLQW